MKATVKSGKIVHNWKQNPLNGEYWKSDCGLVYSKKRLKEHTGAISRVCLHCAKHEG